MADPFSEDARIEELDPGIDHRHAGGGVVPD
jgi:hypothetical protein